MYFPNAASGNEWNRMATLSIRFYSLHLRCIVHCINSSYSEYWLRRAKGSLLKKASETSISMFNFREFCCRFLLCKRFAMTRALEKQEKKVQEKKNLVRFSGLTIFISSMLYFFLFSFVFSCFSKAAEGVNQTSET